MLAVARSLATMICILFNVHLNFRIRSRFGREYFLILFIGGVDLHLLPQERLEEVLRRRRSEFRHMPSHSCTTKTNTIQLSKAGFSPPRLTFNPCDNPVYFHLGPERYTRRRLRYLVDLCPEEGDIKNNETP